MSELSVKVLRHIADLHEAGIIADRAKVQEELKVWTQTRNNIALTDYFIAEMSETIFTFSKKHYLDFPAAIAKNNRRLDWMRDNPDPTKTPVELWEAAKIALKEVER